MDAIDILGSLLGQKSGGSGAGADILKEIFGTGPQRQAPSSGSESSSPRSSAAPRSSPSRTGSPPTEDDIERQARELEDMLNIAKNRSAGRPSPQTQTSQPQAAQPRASQAGPATRQAAPEARQSAPQSSASRAPQKNPFELPEDDAERQVEQATILVRAMVQAAKCDGEITRDEQQKIIAQLESPTPAAIQFLRDEFDRPFDIREFAWSVPVGMEQQVYTMSLIAIDVDTQREQSYLSELAHGLRLTPEICEQIKQRLTGGRTAAAR